VVSLWSVSIRCCAVRSRCCSESASCLFTGLAAKLASVAAEGNAVGRVVHGLGHATGLVIIGFAIVHVLAGYGVLQMQNWGRLLTILFSAIGGGTGAGSSRMVHANVSFLAFGLINAACILYLSMPPIRRAFRAEAARCEWQPELQFSVLGSQFSVGNGVLGTEN